MSGIFLSYARENGDFALRLGRDLKAAGVDVWIDQLAILGGEIWDHAVQEALEGCSILLVVLSPEAISSRSVMDEVSFALDEGKRVVPVVYRACKTPFRLRRVQYVDFTGDYAQGLSHLTALLAMLARTPPPPPPPPPPGRPSSEGRRSQPREKGVPVAEAEAEARGVADRAWREREARQQAEREDRARREQEAKREAEAEAARLEAAERLERDRRAREAREREELARRERDAPHKAERDAAARAAADTARGPAETEQADRDRPPTPGPGIAKPIVLGAGLLGAVVLTIALLSKGPPEPVGLSATPAWLAMTAGDSARVGIQVRMGNGSLLDPTYPAEWVSSDTAIAAVGPDGTVSARTPGRASVTALYGGLQTSVQVTVEQRSAGAQTPLGERETVAGGPRPGRRPDIQPTAVSTTGAIRGVVRDNLGQAIPAQVLLAGTTRGMLANAQGSFAFTDVAPGRWLIVARYIGYATETTTVVVAAGPAATAAITLRPITTVQADIPVRGCGTECGTIQGRVIDESGAPIAGASVTDAGSNLQTVTHADGRYTLAVPSGTRTLRVLAAGHVGQSTLARVSSGRVSTADMVLRLDAPGALRFLESNDSGRTGVGPTGVFDSAVTRWIIAEVSINHAPAARTGVDTLRCTLYHPSGIVRTGTALLFVRAGERRSTGEGVWGSSTPGGWGRGRYRMECSWSAAVTTTGTFTVR